MPRFIFVSFFWHNKAILPNFKFPILIHFSADNAVGTTKSPASNTVYPPIICGVNTGQHMYLDAGRSSTANMAITNTFSTTSFSRYWSIKISQIECDSPAAPPESTCLQYFTGATGIVKSFNFDSTSTTVVSIYLPHLIILLNLLQN